MATISRITALLALGLAACGGGSSSPTPPPPPAAPSNLSYPAPPAFQVGTAIAALSPMVTGTVTAYSSTPALPAGLSLNATSGAITGTPTTAQAASNYQVTASNSGGNTTTSISITVNDVAPAVTYPQAAYIFTTGVPVQPISPASTGGAVTSWALDHALPAGLTFSTTNGQIAGTPTAVAASSAYVVTATNSGGTTTFDLDIRVRSGVLLDLGHAVRVTAIEHDGSRMMSVDTDGHRVLWNAQTGAILNGETAGCNNYCGPQIALAGPTAVSRHSDGFIVRDSATGAYLSGPAFAAAPDAWWRLASDGSYVAAGNSTGLRVWSRAGTVILSRDGNYSAAVAFAAPAELRLAGGPAGVSLVEYISLPAGTSTLSTAYQGAIHSWFGDGERFFTATGNTIWVYSRLAIQQDIAALPALTALAGRGSWYWSRNTNGSLRVHAVGSGGTPTTTFAAGPSDDIVPSGNTIAIIANGGAQLSVIDLGAGAPTRTDYTPPILFASAYGAASATDWAFANRDGVLLGEVPATGSPQVYARGAVTSIVGNDHRFAIVSAYGKIEYFDSATLAPEGEIAFPASRLSLSADGTVLAAGPKWGVVAYSNDRSIRLYSLPSASVLFDRPYTASANAPSDYAMSESANTVAEFLLGSYRVTQSDGTPIFSNTFTTSNGLIIWPPVVMAPGGGAFATSNGEPTSTATSNIYVAGTLSGATVGLAAGWLDDTHLLVNRYTPRGNSTQSQFAGADIVSPTGQVLSSPPLIELHEFQRLSTGTLYSPRFNVILDVATGHTLWSSAAPIEFRNVGAVAGANVIFAYDAYVRVEPR